MANVELGPFVTVEQLGRYKDKSDEAYAITEGEGIEIEGRKISLGDMATDSCNGPILSTYGEGWAEQQTTTGKNLCEFPTNGERVDLGITFAYQPDGSVHVSGTSTGISSASSPSFNVPAGTYTVSGCPAGGAVAVLYMYVMDVDSSYVIARDTGNGASFTLSENKSLRVSIDIRPAAGAVDTTFYPQLEAGSTATSYEPYTGGMPSPNPDYPQEIRVSRGRNLVSNNAVDYRKPVDYMLFDLPLEQGKTYTASLSLVGSSMTGHVIAIVKSGERYSEFETINFLLGSNGNIVSPKTFIVDSSYTAPKLAIYAESESDLNSVFSNYNIQLELGSTPSPYVPYGHVGLEVQGKNLLDPTEFPASATTNGIVYTNNGDGSISFSGTATANTTRGISWPAISPKLAALISQGGKFTLLSDKARYNSSTFNFSLAYSESGTTKFLKLGDTVTIQPGAALVNLSLYAQSGVTIDATDNFHLMLELGDTATPYEPYHHTTTPIPLPAKGFAASLPDGTADALSIDSAGRWEWVSETAQYVFDGDESWNKTSSTTLDVFTYNFVASGIVTSRYYYDILSSHFVGGSVAVANRIMTDNGYINLTFASGTFADASGYKSWLATHNMTLLYPLATPTTEHGRITIPDVPEGSTVTIPELENVNVKCFLKGIGDVMRSVDEKASTQTQDILDEVDGRIEDAVEALTLSDIPIVTDSHDGPIYSATAQGWAEQQITTGKNLLPNNATSQTINGVTFTVNPDGSVTVNGTASTTTVFTISAYTTFEQDCMLSGCPSGGSPASYALILNHSGNPYYDTGNGVSIPANTSLTYANYQIRVASGYTCNNLTFYPQLEAGSTATAYEPYTGGAPSPSPDYPQEIKVARGRNLLDESTPYKDGYYINASGVETAENVFHILTADASPGAYTLSMIASGNNTVRVHAYTSSGVWIQEVVSHQNGTFSFIAPQNTAELRVSIYKANTQVQLELGSTPTPYVPYGYVGLEVQGRNLISGLLQGSYDTSSGNYASNTTYVCTNKMPCNANTEYVFSTSYSHTVTNDRIVFWKADNTFIRAAATSSAGTFTTPADAAFMAYDIKAASSVSPSDVAWAQIEAGSTPTPYEPYHHTTTPIPLPSKGFAASLPDGTADALSVDSAGKWEWRNSTAFADLGSLNWTIITTGTYNRFYSSSLVGTIKPSKIASTVSNCFSESYAAKSFNEVYIAKDDYTIAIVDQASGDKGKVNVVNSDYATEAEFKTGNAGVELLYELATSTTEHGYVDLPLDIPEGSTITIPELAEVGVRCFVPGAKELAQHAANWGKRSRHEDEEIEDAIADLATRVAVLES